MHDPLPPARHVRRAHPVLSALCAVPVVVALYYVFVSPQARYTTDITIQAPGGARRVDIEHARLEFGDRALLLSGQPGGVGPGQRPDGQRLLIRSSLPTAEAYHHVRGVMPTDQIRLHLLLPADAPGYLALGPDWTVTTEAHSDYWRRVLGRMYGLLFGFLCSVGLYAVQVRRGRSGHSSQISA